MRIDDIPIVGVASAVAGTIGYLGGQTARTLSSSTSPTSHALVYGLTVWSTCLISSRIHDSIINNIFALAVGYTASVFLTNLMGYSVTLAGPLFATTALVGSVALVAIPILIIVGIYLVMR